jgi:molybdate transport system substrate-binding protein
MIRSLLLRRVLLVALALSVGLGLSPLKVRAADDAPVIAAAADLKFALAEIASAFKAQTGQEVKLSFGSTGNFARQIRQGAPFQMFLAADEQYVIDLAHDGYTKGEGQLYAVGRIVMIVPKGSTLKPDGMLEGLKAALAAGTITHFAIANPDHAPYGLRSKEALQHQGLWDAIQSKLVLGENVSQAAQFALSGDAQGGIIAYSLAKSPEVSALGDYDLIPITFHDPLDQRMVLLKSAGPVAEAFYAYMTTPPARAIMAKYGFVLPGE